MQDHLPPPRIHFVSLPETLCLVVSSLHQIRQPTRVENIYNMLRRQYFGMSIPTKEIVHDALECLTAEGRMYRTSDAYFLTAPWMTSNPSYPPGPAGPPYHHPFIEMTRSMPGPLPSPYTTGAWYPSNSMPRSMMMPQERKSPEVCSQQCQTGASIVNAIPPYNPNKGKVSNVACSTAGNKQDSKVTTANGGKDKGGSGKVSKSKETGKEKRTFMEKFFRRRSKSKTRDSNSGEKVPIRSNSADSKLSSIAADKENATETQADAKKPVVHSTFNAQFPPPEWLYQPSMAPRCRMSLGPRDIKHHSRTQDALSRGGVWIDLEPSHPSDIRNRRRTGDFRFASHRIGSTIPEEFSGSGGSPGGFIHGEKMNDYVRRARHRQRLSKYLSSSSECLKSIDLPPQGSPGEKRQHRRSHCPTSAHDSKYAGVVTKLESLPVTEPAEPAETKPKYPGQKLTASFEFSPVRSSSPVQILPDALDVDTRTSTPTPPNGSCPQKSDLAPKTDNHATDIALRASISSAQNDSALSISPAESGGKGGSNSGGKYSSWSSADETGGGLWPSPGSSDQMGGEAPADPPQETPESKFDHTYVNLAENEAVDGPTDRMDHTYENISAMDPPNKTGGILDATKFEDITNYAEPADESISKSEPRKMPDLAPRISRTYVSAL